ncbi:BsuPI-related putative proteinase inhibitor [Metabacillus sp. RGM 3146]|uniref:BsuPI-related putative proteinase inhibitor n=1 Tax=Metabacillus sp. RGM 3146 TaxID=3401092 RepID=UPI003B993433
MNMDNVALSADAVQQNHQVVFTLTVQNLSDSKKSMEFRSGQKYEIQVKDSSGEEIYRYSKGKMFIQSLSQLVLEPGESKSYKETWDYFKEGHGLKTGKYQAAFTFLGKWKEDGTYLTADKEFDISEK